MSEQKDKKGEFLTAEQLAKMLQISEASVHRLRRQGRIPAVVLSPRLIRFNLREVKAALAAQQTEIEERTERVEDRTDNRQLAFSDLFMERID